MEVAGITITRPEGSPHKGQICYRCYTHLSEANCVRYVMDQALMTEPQKNLFSPAVSPVVIGMHAPALGSLTEALQGPENKVASLQGEMKALKTEVNRRRDSRGKGGGSA